MTKDEYIYSLEQKIRRLEHKLDKDSQNFELECRKAEIELLERRLSQYEKLESFSELKKPNER